MQLHVFGPWRHTEEEAAEDRDELRDLFQLEYGHGIHAVNLTDHREYRADLSGIDSRRIKFDGSL